MANEISGWRRILNEPVLVSGFVNTLLVAAIEFGADMTQGQMVATMACVNGALALVVRFFVVPNQLAEARVAAGNRPTEPLSK